jgi:hypothetical protein
MALHPLYILPGETSTKSRPHLTHLTFNNGHTGLGSLPETDSFLLPFPALHLPECFGFEGLGSYQSLYGPVETMMAIQSRS